MSFKSGVPAMLYSNPGCFLPGSSIWNCWGMIATPVLPMGKMSFLAASLSIETVAFGA